MKEERGRERTNNIKTVGTVNKKKRNVEKSWVRLPSTLIKINLKTFLRFGLSTHIF